MRINRNEHDNAVDKVLAALRDAVPPEGMETRIAQRLAQHPPAQRSAAPRWRDLLAGSTIAGAWSRGALTGAAVAIVAIGVVLLHHPARSTPDHEAAAARNSGSAPVAAPAATPVSTSPHTAPTGETRSTPCVGPAVTPPPLRNAAPAPPEQKLLAESRDESKAPSHPAPALALTAQERSLVRLVRTSDPQDLSTLNSETQAKVQAQDEADFTKFFAPPAPHRTAETNE